MLTRRQILGGGLSLAVGSGCSIFGMGSGGKRLIPRQNHPVNGEPRLDRLVDSWVTPFEDFFVRSHAAIPDLNPAEYVLTIEGQVERVLQYSLSDLDRLPRIAAPVTIACAKNRAAEHARSKPVESLPWEAGAIGTAEWRGVRLADLLHRAGVKPAAKHVWFEGLDAVALKDRQTVYAAELPVDRAMRSENMVALEMNGTPLTREHGYPARLMAPGCIGAKCVKWLGRIVVAEKKSENHFAAREYAEALDVLLNSAICSPRPGETVKAGSLVVRGYAIASGAALAGVEVSPDGGATWVTARLIWPEAPFAWRHWAADVTVASGTRTLVARATDSRGGKQPEQPPWNAKGLLYNGWHRVPITVS